MKQIQLTQGKVALVDDGDFDWFNQWKWCICEKPNTSYAYRHSHQIECKPIHVKMHREILGLRRNDGKQCDHIDHNGLNNQRSNLRVCTNQQNTFNQKVKGGTSRFKGVCWHRRGQKWMARIKHEYKAIYLGLFKNEIDAASSYDEKAKELFGEFARLNFPETEKVVE